MGSCELKTSGRLPAIICSPTDDRSVSGSLAGQGLRSSRLTIPSHNSRRHFSVAFLAVVAGPRASRFKFAINRRVAAHACRNSRSAGCSVEIARYAAVLRQNFIDM